MENCQVTDSKLKRKNEVALVEQNNLIIDEKTLRKTFSGFFLMMLLGLALTARVMFQMTIIVPIILMNLFIDTITILVYYL